MSATWNGNNILIQSARKHGFGISDTAVLARVLEWINEIQTDICESHDWPFLKFKMKKQFQVGDHEIDLSPQIPNAPTLTLNSGGALVVGSTYNVKITFLLLDETNREFNSIESEPSVASNNCVITTGNQTLSITNIPIYDGQITVYPKNIQRRIYLSKDGGSYYLASTILDNTSTSATIATDTLSTIEPPEYSMVSVLTSEDPIIESKGVTLTQIKLSDMLAYSSNLQTKGTPYYYARISPRKILLYPKPSSTITLSYWVYRVPSRIFNDSTRVIQLDHTFKTLLDAGVTWKGYEYKDESGVESKLSNYDALKDKAKGKTTRTNGQSNTVKEVC